MTRRAPKPTRDEAARAAAEAAAAQENGRLPSELTLSNGIVLALRPIPPGIIERAVARLEKPKVPRREVPGKGVEEDDPSDPEYVAAVAAHEAKAAEAATNTLLLVGTAIKEVPEGLYGPEEVDGWFDKELMAYLGVEAEIGSKFDRYLSWLKLHAMANQQDILAVVSAVCKMAGIGEEDVQDAVARFRGPKA